MEASTSLSVGFGLYSQGFLLREGMKTNGHWLGNQPGRQKDLTSTITHTCDKRDGCISLLAGRGCFFPDKRQTRRPIHSSSNQHPSEDSEKRGLVSR